MFEKLQREKVFRDPIYGYIKVKYKLISDLIDSKEVQRLRRIRQLSGVSMVFQTAEHSRFVHSLGAYHMACLVLENVDGIDKLSEYEKVVLLCSALLHDIGHGPYSHAFENVLLTPHEQMTIKLILSPKTEVNQILSKYENLASDIAGVIAHDKKYPLLEDLVSSQLDVDRMDYLSRDAYMTGASYGVIDYNRILRSMKITDDKKLVVKASGVHSIESYLMSRYHMYFQVYYHPAARAYECILEGIYARIKDLVKSRRRVDAEIQSFLNVLKNNDDVESYIDLDDSYVNGFIKQLIHSCDEVLNKLANAFENRRLFECIELSYNPKKEFVDEIVNKYTKSKLGKYYYMTSNVSAVTYLKSDSSDIRIILPDNTYTTLYDYSPIISSLSTSSYKTLERIYYFKDVE